MWYQLRIESCQPDEVEPLNDALLDAGALSVTLTDQYDDPVLEPGPGSTPLWPHVVITGLFEHEDSAQQVKAILDSCYPKLSSFITELADQAWERVWMDEFKPICFGKRLWVCPSWTPVPEADKPHLILDPGLAFGSGTHPTTALCLSWLAVSALTGKQVIDFGCGSGILALAALKLGAQHVQAVDIDPQALTATTENARINNIPKNALTTGLPDTLHEPADILIANILLAPLLSLKSQFKALLKAQGTLVVSGLLNEQVDKLEQAYQGDFTLTAVKNNGDWALCVFKID